MKHRSRRSTAMPRVVKVPHALPFMGGQPGASPRPGGSRGGFLGRDPGIERWRVSSRGPGRGGEDAVATFRCGGSFVKGKAQR